LEYAYLAALGFLVGLSGAMIPGPLLVYTIAASMRRGPLTGFFVILGHAAVEVAACALILLGASSMLSSEAFMRAVGILGGTYMAYAAWQLRRSVWKPDGGAPDMGYGAVAGGIIYTALNPSFPLWWATAGTRLLLEGLSSAGLAGALTVLAGHWAADLGWYVLVSWLVARGSISLVGNAVGRVKGALAAAMFLIGACFFLGGLRPFK
jgi:threonine/homoserine/homoserine lactone efflux protein